MYTDYNNESQTLLADLDDDLLAADYALKVSRLTELSMYDAVKGICPSADNPTRGRRHRRRVTGQVTVAIPSDGRSSTGCRAQQ